MDYRYLVLVITGFALSVAGFIAIGRKKMPSAVSGLVFLAGVCSLILGVLLTLVPDFFKG